MPLLGLSNELIIDIAKYLDEKSLGRLTQTCAPLRRLLDHVQYDAATKGVDGISPLIWAVRKRRLSLVAFLLKNGADIEAVKKSKEIGWPPETALQQAAQLGDKAMVNFLLKKGANIDAQGVCPRKTALHFAAEEGASEMVKLLLKRGANTKLVDIMFNTPLYTAAKGRVERYQSWPPKPPPPGAWSDCVRLLLEYGSPIEGGTGFDPSETPLHVAVMFTQAPVVKLLLQKGANINARCHRGTPLELAERCYKAPELRYYQPAMEIADLLTGDYKRYRKKGPLLRFSFFGLRRG